MIKKIIARLRAWFTQESDAPPLMGRQFTESAAPVEMDAPEVKARRKQVEPLRSQIADEISNILDLFASADRDYMLAGGKVDGHHNLIDCDFHYINELAEKTSGEDRFYLMGDAKDASDLWPMDIAFVAWVDPVGLKTSRISTVLPQQVRGMVTICPQKMVNICHGAIKDGKWWAENTICGYVNNQWRPIETRVVSQRETSKGIMQIRRSAPIQEELDVSIPLAAGVALTERYSWHVAIGNGDGPRVLLPTSSQGCIALFKDRDKPAEGRRATLKHWVTEHYREVENPEIGVTRVCEHLRGNTIFNWRGLECEILVSAYDLEKNEFFREQAAEWRSQRKHNQVTYKKLPRSVKSRRI